MLESKSEGWEGAHEQEVRVQQDLTRADGEERAE